MDIKRNHCIRCGECCLRASPTLQREDVWIVEQGIIAKGDLYTIRAGEMVHDNIRSELRKTDAEMIKVREKSGASGCIYYDHGEKACRIYEHRPSQCAALECWDETKFLELYEGPKASRGDLISDGIVLRLMEEHEKRCGYRELEALVKRIRTEGEKAVERILDMLRFDHQLRPFASEKIGIRGDETDLITRLEDTQDFLHKQLFRNSFRTNERNGSANTDDICQAEPIGESLQPLFVHDTIIISICYYRSACHCCASVSRV